MPSLLKLFHKKDRSYIAQLVLQCNTCPDKRYKYQTKIIINLKDKGANTLKKNFLKTELKNKSQRNTAIQSLLELLC